MQDLLGYGNEARMNAPSTYGNNWKWRLLKDEFGEKEVKTLYEITKRYGRIGK
jgi:4-alpha-glucanotransferase